MWWRWPHPILGQIDNPSVTDLAGEPILQAQRELVGCATEIPMIELRQLRYLIAAADAGSFSRAARNFNIKQATLSRHILEVEKRLGMVLFDRKTRGATLTSNGKIYLRTAQRIVTEFEELNARVRATNNGGAGIVDMRLGPFPALGLNFARNVAQPFGGEHVEPACILEEPAPISLNRSRMMVPPAST